MDGPAVKGGREPSIDDVRAFWDGRPCNVRHSAAPVGSREFFDQVEARKYHVESHIPGFAQFERWKGLRVLEIGCGIGTDAVNFARAGARYTGVDLSQASLKLAIDRFRLYGLTGRFRLGNAERNLYDGERFDLVYSFGVLHHTPHPEWALAAIRRVMTPESEFRLMLYAADSWKAAMIRANLDQPEAQSGCPIARMYTRAEARELLSEAGFRVTEMHQDHIFPYQVAAYKEHRYELEPWFAAMPAGMREALEKQFGWHLLITCELEA